MTPAEMTEEQRAATPSLVALCPKCGSLLACAVVQPEFRQDNAKAVASWVKDGLTVKTIPVSEVRTAKWCHCPGRWPQVPERFPG